MTYENRKHLGESLIYIFLLVFFTYTNVAFECLKDFSKVGDAYLHNQASPMAMLTNFGLVLLLVIDYISQRDKVDSHMALMLSGVFFLDIIIYGHATVIAHPQIYADYKVLLAIPSLYAFLHVITIFFLVYIRYKTVNETVASLGV